MSKRSFAKVIIVLLILSVIGLAIYFFFPKIWGDLLYPLDYEEQIIKYSKEFNVDPIFVSAVIYSESHFNKDATSRVGARGLMQIMPSTGASIASRLGDSSYNVDKLYEPDTNIRYGCWYLRYLLDNYNNDKNAALAGYNGGGAVGDRYVYARESGIPQETQGYIKTVNFAMGVYNKLYAGILTGENVKEKLKTNAEEKPTFMQGLVNYFKKTIYGQ